MVTMVVTSNFRPLARFTRALEADIRGNGRGALHQALTGPVAAAYFTGQNTRFNRNSAGGGDWPALSPVTIALRKDKGRGGILRISKSIQTALKPGAPGNLIARIPDGVRLGVGGPARHPDAPMSIGELIERHYKGGTRLPRRSALALPDRAAGVAMYRAVVAGVGQMARQAAIGP